MLKAIIFDITGVIFPCQPWIGDRPPKEELMKIKQVAIDIYNKEKMSKEYLKEKIFEADRPKEELQQIYNSLTCLDHDLFELIKRLSKQYDLYCLANEAPKWTDIRKDLYHFDAYFKKLFISVEIGKRKPDPDIFDCFLEETGLKPGECLFVDDAKRNIETADKLGFHTYQYSDFKAFNEFIKPLLKLTSGV